MGYNYLWFDESDNQTQLSLGVDEDNVYVYLEVNMGACLQIALTKEDVSELIKELKRLEKIL